MADCLFEKNSIPSSRSTLYVCLFVSQQRVSEKKNERKLTWVASLISRKTDDFTMSGSHFFCYSEKQSMQFVKSTFPSRIEPCNLIHRLYKKKNIWKFVWQTTNRSVPLCLPKKKEREMRAAKKNLVHNIGTTINSFLFMRKNVN